MPWPKHSVHSFATCALLVAILSTTALTSSAGQVGVPTGRVPYEGVASMAPNLDVPVRPEQPSTPVPSDSGVPWVAPIGPNAGLRLTASEMDLLAHIINGEARGESFLGQVAVGAVVLNRVRCGGEYGSTVSEVIYRPGQFEPVRNGQINLTPTASCVLAAMAAAQGQDPTSGALYFWEPDRTFSSYLWSRALKIEIGGHRFTE